MGGHGSGRKKKTGAEPAVVERVTPAVLPAVVAPVVEAADANGGWPARFASWVEFCVSNTRTLDPVAQVYRVDGVKEDNPGFVNEMPMDNAARASAWLAEEEGPGWYRLDATEGGRFRRKCVVRVTADRRKAEPPPTPPPATQAAPQSTNAPAAASPSALTVDQLVEAIAARLGSTPAKGDEVDKLERLGNMFIGMTAKLPGAPKDGDDDQLEAVKFGVSLGEKSAKKDDAPWYGPIIEKHVGEVVSEIKKGGKLGWELLKEYRKTKQEDAAKAKAKAAQDAEKAAAEERAKKLHEEHATGAHDEKRVEACELCDLLTEHEAGAHEKPAEFCDLCDAEKAAAE